MKRVFTVPTMAAWAAAATLSCSGGGTSGPACPPGLVPQGNICVAPSDAGPVGYDDGGPNEQDGAPGTIDAAQQHPDQGGMDLLPQERDLAAVDAAQQRADQGGADLPPRERDQGIVDAAQQHADQGSPDLLPQDRDLGAVDAAQHHPDLGSPDLLPQDRDLGTVDAAQQNVDQGSMDLPPQDGGLGTVDGMEPEKDLGMVDAPPAPPSITVMAFDDNFAGHTGFANFGGATNAISVDSTTWYEGQASLKIEVPSSGYTGGAIVASEHRDLSRVDVLTFWAKASSAGTLDKVGFGNDATSETYSVEYEDLELTTTWRQYVVPIPNPAVLTATKGLFHFAQGASDHPFTIWIDEIRLEKLAGGAIGAPSASIANANANLQIGQTTTVEIATSGVTVHGVTLELKTPPVYFTFRSSDTSVATVDSSGTVTAHAPGDATITAELGPVKASGELTVRVTTGAGGPSAAPVPPGLASDKVISLFSDAFDDVGVDTWSTSWDLADVDDVFIDGNATKIYTNMEFAGIEFHANVSTIDASQMTHFHIDVYLPAAVSFGVKLVDFGADRGHLGGDDSEHELLFDENTSPPLTSGRWVSLDLPLTLFSKLKGRNALAQIILSSTTPTVYVDNVYFYRN